MAIALMMVSVSTSDTSVNFYKTTRRNNPEDSHLHTRRRENLKSHITACLLIQSLSLGYIFRWIYLLLTVTRYNCLF
jgi:hypothetical protein